MNKTIVSSTKNCPIADSLISTNRFFDDPHIVFPSAKDFLIVDSSFIKRNTEIS